MARNLEGIVGLMGMDIILEDLPDSKLTRVLRNRLSRDTFRFFGSRYADGEGTGYSETNHRRQRHEDYKTGHTEWHRDAHTDENSHEDYWSSDDYHEYSDHTDRGYSENMDEGGEHTDYYRDSD